MAVKAEFDDVIGEFQADQIVDCILGVRKMESGPSKTGGIYKTLVPKGEIPLIPGKSREYYVDELQSQWGGGEFRLFPKDVEGEAIGNKIMIINVPLSEEEERLEQMNEEIEVQKRRRAVAIARKGTLEAETEQAVAERERKKDIEAENQPEIKETGITDVLKVVDAMKSDGNTDLVAMLQIQKSDDASRRAREEDREDKRRIREEDREDKQRIRDDERKREDEKTRKEEKAEAERIRKDERDRWEAELKLREKEVENEREKTNRLLEMKEKELKEERDDRRKADLESSKTQIGFLQMLAKKDQENSTLITAMMSDHLTQTRKMTESQINMTDKHVQSTMANLDLLREREGYANEEEPGSVMGELSKGLVDVIKEAAARPPAARPIRQPAQQPGQVGPPKPVPEQPTPGVSLDETGAATTLIQRLGQYAPEELGAILGYMRDNNHEAARAYAAQTLDSEYGPLAALTIKAAKWQEIHDAIASTIDLTAKNGKKTRAIIETPGAQEWWEQFRLALVEFSEEDEAEEPEEAFEDEPEEEIEPENKEVSPESDPVLPVRQNKATENTEDTEKEEAE